MHKLHYQRGFTIAIVLVMMFLASVLVFRTIQTNVYQERVAGNMRKQINAQLAAEQGVYEIMYTMQQALLSANPSITTPEQLLQTILQQTNSIQGQGHVAGSQYSIQLSADGNQIGIVSDGASFEGAKQIFARLAFTPGESIHNSPFVNAITGCNGVSLQGAGLINSFDSTLGNYDPSNALANADVKTIETGAGIELAGNSPIYGDVLGAGAVTLLGSSPVIGNIHANGDVVIAGGNGAYPYRVSGQIMTRSDYRQASVTVHGDVLVQGDAELTWSSQIITKVLRYGGQLTLPNWWTGDSSQFVNDMPEVAVVPHSTGTTDDTLAVCDPFDINSTMGAFDEIAESRDLHIGQYGSRNFEFSPTRGHFTDFAQQQWYPQSIQVKGNTISAYVVDDLSVSQNGTLDISGGDVIVYLSGDFSMSGGVELRIAAGSSLTLYIEGQFTFTGGSISVQQHGLTDSEYPAFAIYSSYVSESAEDLGVEISGASDLYAVIYAPFADVEVRGAGKLYGAVLGKTVNAVGAGSIHYDQALSEAGTPTETVTTSGKVELVNIFTY